jgi:hypothetical protein
MDVSWNGAMVDGVRVYSPSDFRYGFILMVGVAWFGTLAAWRLRETCCRNVWKRGST